MDYEENRVLGFEEKIEELGYMVKINNKYVKMEQWGVFGYN